MTPFHAALMLPPPQCCDCGALMTGDNAFLVARNERGELVLWRGPDYSVPSVGHIQLCPGCAAQRKAREGDQ